MSRYSKARAIALVALFSALSLPAHASAVGDFNAGYDALLQKNYARAIEHFSTAIASGDLKPANLALAHHWRGAEYLKTGRDDEAIADFDRALALNPKLYTAYYDRAIALRHKGELTRAIADFNEAIRQSPNVHYFYLHRGQAYAANHQLNEAVADYKQALYYQPESVPTFVALGDALMEQGRRAEALDAFQQAMRRKGDLLKVYPGIGAKLTALRGGPETNKLVLE